MNIALMQSKMPYLFLIVAGAIAGWQVTRPAHLRWRRIFQIALLPVVFCALFRGGIGLAYGTVHPIVAIPVLLTAAASLFLTLTPNLFWFYQSRLDPLNAPRRKPPLLDDLHMQPIRQLVEGQKFAEGCARFELLLKSHRGDFSQVLLLTQLYHQLKRNKQAEKCALQMIGLARDVSEQFTAMHFYHELVGHKPAGPKPAVAQPDKPQAPTAQPAPPQPVMTAPPAIPKQVISQAPITEPAIAKT